MEKIEILPIKKFNEIEQAVSIFLANVGLNAFDNYNHRTTRVAMIVRTIWKDYELDLSRNGRDSYCKSLGLKDVEVKTSNITSKYAPKPENESKTYFSKMSFMFDKQDRKVRREVILRVDGLVFAVFCIEKLKLVIWTCHKKTIKEYKKIVKAKQKVFLKHWKKIQKEGKKSGNDAINIGPKDFSNNSIWNFYYNKSIYKDATLAEIKKILKVK